MVLIVDDDADDIEFFQEALSEVFPEAKYCSASDGEEALQVLKNTSPAPDYIFLDLNMPRMDGKTFLSIIKSDNKYNSIPVIIYTTASNPELIKSSKELGADHFLSKPTALITLCREIKKIMAITSKNNPDK